MPTDTLPTTDHLPAECDGTDVPYLAGHGLAISHGYAVESDGTESAYATVTMPDGGRFTVRPGWPISVGTLVYVPSPRDTPYSPGNVRVVIDAPADTEGRVWTRPMYGADRSMRSRQVRADDCHVLA